MERKRIGFVRTDYHSLIFAYCLGPSDRYEFRRAGGQLYILEYESQPTIPVLSTVVAGCFNPPNERKRYGEGEAKLGDRLTPEQFGRAFSCPVYSSLEEMADPAKIDAAFIGNCSWYADDHHLLVEPFLKAHIPMFIDKPFADTAAHAKEIIDLARKYNTPIFSTSILLYVGANRALAKKNLGDPRFVVSTFSSKMEQRNASVHTISNLLGAVWSTSGPYEVESVQYIGNEQARGEHEKGNGEVYRVLFKNGVIGILNCNDYNHYSFRLDFFGSNGTDTSYVTEPTLRSGIVDISNEFAKMLQDGIPPLHYDRLFEFVAIIDAALKSREEGGREITIKEIADGVGYELGLPMECKNVASASVLW